MHNTNYLIAVVLGLSLAMTSQAEDAPAPYEPLPAFVTIGEPASDEDMDAIREVLRGTGRGWGQGDAEMVASGYSDDAEWMNAFGQIRRSSAAIRDYLTELFSAQDDAMAEFEEQNAASISLRFIGDNVAIYHGVTRSTRMGALEGADLRRVHNTTVLEKRDGQWLIVHEHISDARPAESDNQAEE
ncbi:MAG: SgcJ/EcaC family oxidoreductase [Pseudomonadota bacterium]